MAKWTFEDYANGAMAIVGIAMMAHSILEAKKVADREDDSRKAKRWVAEATARLENMVHHMQKQRASKECYVEALGAAKNILAFEVRETLTPKNFHMLDAQKEIFQTVDQLIAKAN
jgi:hypothetical protein